MNILQALKLFWKDFCDTHKHKWIDRKDALGYECSECGFVVPKYSKFGLAIRREMEGI